MKQFTIRVYGLLVQEQQILLSREMIKGHSYLKFPGGGLEFGEGTRDCLKREFREEAGIEVEVGAHFYTTDEFVASAFHKQMQVISIYYLVTTKEAAKIPVGSAEEKAENHPVGQVLFWRALQELNPADFPLPIDRKVVESLRVNPGFEPNS